MAFSVENLTHSYGQVTAIGNISAEFPVGSFTCIVGPSGCGKTTLLRCMSGLIHPSGGRVSIDGELVRDPPAQLALVFQDYSRSLYPWMSVHDNVAFPLISNGKFGRAEVEAKVDKALASVGLADAADRYPWQLSGGMQQRTSIARALAYEPSILLMDEPFASVDAQTRSDLEDLVLRIKADFAMTVVFVTHDIDESVYLGDRIIVLGPPPTSVREVLEVNLPEPRDQIQTKSSPDFLQLRSHVYNLIMRPSGAAGKAASASGEGD